MTALSGKIVFRDILSSFANATVVVQCEDLSRTGDIAPRIIAKQVIRGVSLDAVNPHPIPFSIDISAGDISTDCNLSVHVDTNKSGHITVGDYITMQSIPISAPSTSLTIPVDPVR